MSCSFMVCFNCFNSMVGNINSNLVSAILFSEESPCSGFQTAYQSAEGFDKCWIPSAKKQVVRWLPQVWYLICYSPLPWAKGPVKLIHAAHVQSMPYCCSLHLLKHSAHSHKCVIIALHNILCSHIFNLQNGQKVSGACQQGQQQIPVEPPVLQTSTLFILLHVNQHTDVRGEKNGYQIYQ